MYKEVTLENYEEIRKELIEANENQNALILREAEVRVDALLQKLKSEYRAACGRNLDYHFPFLTDDSLEENGLYQFCTRLPKGADLHVHDMALLPVRELIPLIYASPEFYINADAQTFDLKWVNPGEEAPEGYLPFAAAWDSGICTSDDLIRNWTVVGAQEQDVNIWDYFEGLFDKQGALSDNFTFAERYYDYTFRYYARNRIMHVEIHAMLTESLEETEEYLRILKRVYYNVKKDYPFFTLKIIGAGVKADNETIDFTRHCFLNASYAQEIVKDDYNPEHVTNFVIGFDLVNEEDTSLPLHAFAPMLLKVRRQFPEMKLYIHGGESLDAENTNLIDAYLLGVSRVGHGLNLYRYPDLHARFRAAEICLEVCPISNQCLGYTTDLRNHPATEYLRTGMPIALCSDDPAYMERRTLTDDFFAAIVSWNLNLADLKQLSLNSIMYSGLDNEERFASLRAFKELWNQFITEHA